MWTFVLSGFPFYGNDYCIIWLKEERNDAATRSLG